MPAPGRARRADDVARDRTQTFPLCLVCDRVAIGDANEDGGEGLARRCEREAEAGAEAEDGAMQDYYDYRRKERQRLKVNQRCHCCDVAVACFC